MHTGEEESSATIEESHLWNRLLISVQKERLKIKGEMLEEIIKLREEVIMQIRALNRSK